MMESKTQKTLFYVIAIVFLIILIAGISYAVYRFSFTGTKENTITSGHISILYEELTNISLTNKYPESDVIGSSNAESLKFSITSDITGNFSVNYDVGLSIVQQGTYLTADYIKFNLKKGDSYLLGTSATSGITIGSRKNIAGANNLITSYAIDSDVINSTGIKYYEIKAWISEDYSPTMENISEGNVQGLQVNSETFKFKLNLIASQM